MDEFQAATAIKAAHDRKVQGYHETQGTVRKARERERESHEALKSAMKYEVGILQHLKSAAFWTLEGAARGAATTPQSLADKFTKKSDVSFERAAKANMALDAHRTTPVQQAARAAHRDKLVTRSLRQHGEAVKSQNLANRMYSRTPIQSGDVKMLGKSVKGVPVIGTTIAAGIQTEAVVNDGKPVGKAGLNLVGGTLGSVGAPPSQGSVSVDQWG